PHRSTRFPYTTLLRSKRRDRAPIARHRHCHLPDARSVFVHVDEGRVTVVPDPRRCCTMGKVEERRVTASGFPLLRCLFKDIDRKSEEHTSELQTRENL